MKSAIVTVVALLFAVALVEGAAALLDSQTAKAKTTKAPYTFPEGASIPEDGSVATPSAGSGSQFSLDLTKSGPISSYYVTNKVTSKLDAANIAYKPKSVTCEALGSNIGATAHCIYAPTTSAPVYLNVTLTQYTNLANFDVSMANLEH